MSLCWVEAFEDVHDSEIDGCAIVWAPDEASALVAVQKWHGCTVQELPHDVRRMPEWDKFAGNGNIPIAEFVAAGWHIECSRCSRMVQEEMEYTEEELYDEEGNERKDMKELTLIGTSNGAFCCQECHDADTEERRVRKEIKARAKAAFARHMGDEVKVTSVSSVQENGKIHLEFRLPGAICHFTYKFDPAEGEGVVYCNPNDIGIYRRHMRQIHLDRRGEYADGDFANCVG
jgi:hypothetical protein